MKRAATISGVLHLAVLLVAMFGLDWLSGGEPPPLVVSEVDLIDGTNFDAAVSTAPIVPNVGPSELSAPSAGQGAPEEIAQPDDSAQPAAIPPVQQAPAPQQKPDQPDLSIPPPPTNVPTEAPSPTIAEIPSPDSLDVQSNEPESPPSTEPVQPLASAPPVPQAKPAPPPAPEPEPAAEAEPVVAETETPEAERPPEPEREPETRPDPESIAEAQPEAPDGPAPREARLPLAKPAELAAAARAAAQAEAQAQQAAREAERATTQARQPTREAPSQAAGGSTPRLAARLSRGDINAMRLGIKRYYVFDDQGVDPSLAVVVRIRLDQGGRIVGGPDQIRAQGGSASAQKAMFNAARRALLRAQNANVFRKLPADRYESWKEMHFRFTIRNDLRFSS